MIEAIHIAVGAAIAQETGNPVLGMIFAFLSHYVLDFIPHIEYPVSGKRKLKEIPIRDFLKVAADIFIGFSIVLFFAKNLPLALAGGFFGMLPDLITIPSFFFLESKFVRFYSRFHCDIIHAFQTKISSFWRISIQVALIIAAIFFLRR